MTKVYTNIIYKFRDRQKSGYLYISVKYFKNCFLLVYSRALIIIRLIGCWY